MGAEHLDATANANAEHARRMEALGNEHEIRMAHINSAASSMVPNGAEQYRLREWNLSAIDAVQQNQNQAAIEAAEDSFSTRKRMAFGETQKAAVAAVLKTKEDHFKNLKSIERTHRYKMMELEEEKLSIQNDDLTKSVKEDHDIALSFMTQKHARKMEMLKAAHSSRMAQITTVLPEEDPAWHGMGSEAPPREFGVATGELLWSLGMPDEYSESHNLAKKLETALICVAAEKPHDPCKRLAELLA